MVTCLFSFFPVYALLDPGAILAMLTPFVENQFDLLSKILHEPFLVSTPIGDGVNAKGVYREVHEILASPFKIKLGVIRFKSYSQ